MCLKGRKKCFNKQKDRQKKKMFVVKMYQTFWSLMHSTLEYEMEDNVIFCALQRIFVAMINHVLELQSHLVYC